MAAGVDASVFQKSQDNHDESSELSTYIHWSEGGCLTFLGLMAEREHQPSFPSLPGRPGAQLAISPRLGPKSRLLLTQISEAPKKTCSDCDLLSPSHQVTNFVSMNTRDFWAFEPMLSSPEMSWVTHVSVDGNKYPVPSFLDPKNG